MSLLTLTPEEMDKLKRVALGEEKADLVLSNGNIVDVYSGQFLRDYSVAIKGNWIAYVGPSAHDSTGPNTEIIDASGKVLIPGLVDSHAHMMYYHNPEEFLRYAMMGGTTTIITEIMELNYTSGYAGLIEYLDALKNQPIKVFATAPHPNGLNKLANKRASTVEQIKGLLQRDEIVGVGESFWQQVIRGEGCLSEIAAESAKLGKTIEGHAAGAHGEKLMAYLAYGVSSCHESVSLEDVLERLRLGVFVMIREGSIRKELQAMEQLKEERIDSRRIALVTDGVDPRDLIKNGYLEFTLQKAVNVGIDPIKAIQMATINPAEHFYLDSLIGGIGPGKHADIAIIPDLQNIRAECVISKGRVIARQGELLIQPRKTHLSSGLLKTIVPPVKPSDFIIKIEGKGPFKIRVIDQVAELVTRETLVTMAPANGELKSDTSHDLLKVALVSPKRGAFTGFIRGFGMKTGALATSGVWETFGITVVGANEGDMATAVNRVSRLGGGIVLYAKGQVQAELSLPIGGIMSPLPLETVAERLLQINQKAKALGFMFADAPLTLAVLTTPAIPFLRISEEGIIDLKGNRIVDLVVR